MVHFLLTCTPICLKSTVPTSKSCKVPAKFLQSSHNSGSKKVSIVRSAVNLYNPFTFLLSSLFFVISPLSQKLTHKPWLIATIIPLSPCQRMQQHGNCGNKDDTATLVIARRRQRDSRAVVEGIPRRQWWQGYCGGGGGAAAALVQWWH